MCLQMCLHYRFWTKAEFSRKAKVLSTLLQTMIPTKNLIAIFKHLYNILHHESQNHQRFKDYRQDRFLLYYEINCNNVTYSNNIIKTCYLFHSFL